MKLYARYFRLFAQGKCKYIKFVTLSPGADGRCQPAAIVSRISKPDDGQWQLEPTVQPRESGSLFVLPTAGYRVLIFTMTKLHNAPSATGDAKLVLSS